MLQVLSENCMEDWDNFYLEKIYVLLEKSKIISISKKDGLNEFHYSRRIGKKIIKEFQLKNLIKIDGKNNISFTEEGIKRVIPFHEEQEKVLINLGRAIVNTGLREVGATRRLEMINLSKK